jgi:two-component system sensor histidine kinase KdpD
VDGVCVQVVAGTPLPSHPRRPVRALADDGRALARSYLASLALVAVATAVAGLMSRWAGTGALSVVFLTAVLVAATEYGLGPALAASVLSMFCYDFFFIRPIHSLLIETPRDITAFVAFAIAALIASRVATRVREQAYLARRRAVETADLHQLTRGLAGVGTLEEAARVVAARIAAAIDLPAAVILPAEGRASIVFCEPCDAHLTAEDLAAGEACLEAGQAPGPPGPSRSPGGWRFLPIRTADKAIGVVGVRERGKPLEIEKEHRLTIIADQVAIAVDRINLVSDLDRERQRDATDRLHAALLASISHDLRDPLTAILGSAETLDERWPTLPEAVRGELVGTVRTESERLALLVNNLLDMARLEGTAFRARLTHTSLAEIIEAALRRTEKLLDGLTVSSHVEPGLPLLPLDPVLCEQVFFNVLDNASKFAPPGSTIRVMAWQGHQQVHIVFTDEGPGFPPDRIDRVFDKFFHVDAAGCRKGAGLGLTICRGFVTAMDGHIAAENRTDRSGAVVRISFPIPAAARHTMTGSAP